MSYTDPTRRHDFVLLFDVTNGNPNGDPDAGNMPRIDPETNHGLVTDVALKRKIRNYVALALDKPIFIQSQTALNTLILKAFRDIGVQPPELQLADDSALEWLQQNPPDGFDLDGNTLIYGGEATSARDIQANLFQDVEDNEENKELRAKLHALAADLAAAVKAGKKKIEPGQRAEAKDRLCRDYFDIRLFGAVLGTGLNAGQVRGPAQLTFARSIDPILPLDLAITRQARTTTARMLTGGTEIGRKTIVPYGLYRAHGFFSPQLAKQTGVSKEDLNAFWEALRRLFDLDRSAARPEMEVRGLYVFSHESPLGNAPSHKLFDRIRVSRATGVDTPRSFEDYTVEVASTDLPKGVAMEPLVGVGSKE